MAGLASLAAKSVAPTPVREQPTHLRRSRNRRTCSHSSRQKPVQTYPSDATCRQRLRAVSDDREFIAVPGPRSLDECVDRDQQPVVRSGRGRLHRRRCRLSRRSGDLHSARGRCSTRSLVHVRVRSVLAGGGCFVLGVDHRHRLDLRETAPSADRATQSLRIHFG